MFRSADPKLIAEAERCVKAYRAETVTEVVFMVELSMIVASTVYLLRAPSLTRWWR